MSARAARGKTARKIEIRREDVVTGALRQAADRFGFEPADHAASLLNRALLGEVSKVDRKHAGRVRAEAKLKLMVAALARKLSPPGRFDAHVTMRVFKTIRTDDELRRIYLRAVGGRSVYEINNPVKARMNKALAANIQEAILARPLMSGGRPVRGTVRGECVFSYTVLTRRVEVASRSEGRRPRQAR